MEKPKREYCRRWECRHYCELDDGEDEHGNPYPPDPCCCYRGGLIGLCEDWMGPQACGGKFEPEEER